MLSGGKRFSRERQNESDYQIRNFVDALTAEHIAPILNKTIVTISNDRYASVDILISDIRAAIYSLQGHFNPTSLASAKLCRNCGQANCLPVVDNDPTDARNFGFTPFSGSKWHIYVCPECSHISIFRPDTVPRRR